MGCGDSLLELDEEIGLCLELLGWCHELCAHVMTVNEMALHLMLSQWTGGVTVGLCCDSYVYTMCLNLKTIAFKVVMCS